MHYPQGPHAHRPPMGSDVCTMCRTVGWPRTETPGNIGVELLLWLLCLLPGIIYSVWRLASRRRVCATCGSPNIVPLASPMGRQLTGM